MTEINNEVFLSEDEERLLLRIARDSLTAWVRESQCIGVESYPLTDRLREKRGAFVTLRKGDELRGCIGYTANRTPLAETVRDNAVNAACNDTRFPPVMTDELDSIWIEISVLTPGDTPETPYKRIHGPEDIVIGRDGLFVQRPGTRGGLLLPQVAVDQNWGIQEFLEAVCFKAGYPENAWQDPETRLYRFSAQVFAEPRR